MTRAQAVLATLVVYKAALLGIGLYARGRTRDGVDFFLGGRRLGPTVAAVSASASSSSAWTLLGVSGAAYAWGFGALWLFPACVGGFALNWYVLAPRLRTLSHASGAVTVTDVLASRDTAAGRATRWAAALIVLFSLTVYVASQFQGSGKTFEEVFGMSATASILVGSTIVVAYTLLGGFWAVSLTDTLQGLVMAATAVILPVGVLIAAGGPMELLDGLAEVEDVTTGPFVSVTRGMTGAAAVGFVIGLLGIGLGYPGQPHVVNRFMALEQGDEPLRRARRIALVWAVVVYAGMLVTGWAGRVLFPVLPDNEVVFLAAAGRVFPPVVGGVMIAAVLSAIMSTADSQLLVAASSVSHDLAPSNANRARPLLRSRLVVVGLSAVAVAAALFGSREIFSPVLFAWTALGAAFGPLLVVTVLRGPVPPGRTLAAMLTGFACAVAAYSFPESRGSVIERIVPFAAALAVIFLPGRGTREGGR